MATLYFNNAVNQNWATLGNWWTNSSYTTPASALPTSSDDVVVRNVVSSNTTGTTPTVASLTTIATGSANPAGFTAIRINLNVSGNATLSTTAIGTSTVSVTLNVGGTLTLNSTTAVPVGPFWAGTINAANLVLSHVGASNVSFAVAGTLNRYINANCTFTNVTIGAIIVTGSCTLSNASPPYGAGASYGAARLQGPENPRIIGDCVFNDSGIAGAQTTVVGNVTLNGASRIEAQTQPTAVGGVTGNVVCNGTSIIDLPVSGNATLNDYSSWRGYTISGNVVLNDSAFTAANYSAVAGGNVTFNESSYHLGTLTVANSSTTTFNGNSYRIGAINGGTVVYDGLDGVNEYGYFSNGNLASGYHAPTETYYIAGQATTLNSSGTGSWNGLYYVNAVLASGWIGGTYYISGNATSLDSSGTGYNSADNSYYITGTQTTLDSNGTGSWSGYYYITGTQTTLDGSGNGSWNNSYYITGTQTTLDSSGNGSWDGYYYITGAQTTLDSNGTGSWNGYYYITGTQTTLDGSGNGSWNGTEYLDGIAAATIRFTGNGDWNSSGNWQQGYVPRTIDSAEIATGATCDSNSGSPVSIVNLTLESGAVISIDLTVSGVATFLGTSAKGGTSVITGNAVFHPDAENRTGITGTVTFLRGRGINGSSILGVV
jgi:hypothetical protein